MVKIVIAYSAAALALLVSCARGGSASTAPQGWKPMPGSGAAWTSGSGAQAQEYRYARTKFAGSLQDLASAVTIDVLLHHPGAKLKSSNPFVPCPGQAGVASFLLPGGKALDEGFAVYNGNSVRTTYLHPAGSATDPSIAAAMQSALCVRPA